MGSQPWRFFIEFIQMNLTATTHISTTLAESLSAHALLYWFARMLDKDGRGCAVFTVGEAAEALDKGESTIRRYLRLCMADGLFTDARCKSGVYRVHYRSLVKVAVGRGLDDFGVFFEAEVDDLRKLKFINTEVTAQSLQEQSFYNAQEEKRAQLEQRRYKGTSIDDIFGKGSANSQRFTMGRNVVYVGKGCIFVSEQFMMHGASQSTIAQKLDRCDRTIQNRLSNQYREERGVSPLLKRQLVQRTDWNADSWNRASELVRNQSSDLDLVRGSQRYFVSGPGKHVWFAGCNLYSLSHSLKRKGYLRNRLDLAVGELM